MSTWICDIDGTLALRQAHGRSPFDWDRVGEDLPNKPVVELVRALTNFHHVILVTGRMEQCRRQTVLWLEANIWPQLHNAELHMRGDGDYRPDDVVKREIYEQEIAPTEIMGVIDDRDKVVRMWREELGLTCIQVASGNF